MMEFAKVVSVLHHRVRADLLETFSALGLDDLTLLPTKLCEHRKTLFCLSFVICF